MKHYILIIWRDRTIENKLTSIFLSRPTNVYSFVIEFTNFSILPSAARKNERPQQIDNQKRLDGRTRASPGQWKRNYPSLLIRFEVNNLVKSGEQNVTRVARTGPTAIINLSAPSSTRPRWNIISRTEARREFARLLVFVLPPFPRSTRPRGNSHTIGLNDASCRLRFSFRRLHAPSTLETVNAYPSGGWLTCLYKP